jgi:polyhydroxyalkanoate synthesis regulator phasin
MAPNDGLRRYLEAGLALTQITRARAEELVHELIQAGEVETTRAQDWVEDLVKASRDRSDTLLSTVRGEVRNQLSDLGITNMDDLAHRVADLLDRAETAARRATSRGPRGRTTTRSSARATKAKKAPPRKAPAKKTTAKTAPAKKSAARATKAKKAPARKAPAKKTTTAAATTKKTAGRSSAAAKARR